LLNLAAVRHLLLLQLLQAVHARGYVLQLLTLVTLLALLHQLLQTVHARRLLQGMRERRKGLALVLTSCLQQILQLLRLLTLPSCRMLVLLGTLVVLVLFMLLLFAVVTSTMHATFAWRGRDHHVFVVLGLQRRLLQQPQVLSCCLAAGTG
jgi:hypothetical protein